MNALAALQNYIDVASVTGFNGQVASPTVTEYICVEEAPNAANREYVQVKWVQGNRLLAQHAVAQRAPRRLLGGRGDPHHAGGHRRTWTLDAATGVVTRGRHRLRQRR